MDANLKKIAALLSAECARLTMEDVVLYDVEGKSSLTDMVLIATAAHILQIEAARNTLALIGKHNGLPLRNPTENYSEGWLAMDHGDYVVHVLVPEKRAFYRLDELMKGIKISRAQENGEEEILELSEEEERPELSEGELVRLNAEFDFLTEEELSATRRKKP